MFVSQTFALSDLSIVALLILLEGLLSADNALVLAIMVRHLPEELQRKALTYGLVGAFVFRAVAIAFASFILALWWLQAVGALYLIVLPIKHFRSIGQPKVKKEHERSFWATVIAVEITDVAFAVDSVLAGVAMVHNRGKVWVVYAGGVIGVILLRFAAQLFIRLLKKYPLLDHVAYLLVGWAGIKLMFAAFHAFAESLPGVLPFTPPEMPQWVFWSVMMMIVIGGAILAARQSRLLEERAAENRPSEEPKP